MTEAPAQPRKAPGKRISFALAVLMHVGLAILIIYGIHWQTQKPEVVEVDLVRAAPPAPAPASEPKPETKPTPKPAPVKPPLKPDIAQKEKPKPPPPPKTETKPEPPKDPFKEQLERELKETEKRKAADATAREAAQELANLKAQQANSAKSSALADYIAKIKGKVRGNIILPGDIKGNPEAVFEVTQLPSGEILSVKLKKSSGHTAWDNATERAIRKSSPLPKPMQSELFSHTLELKFRPLEE